MPGSTGTNILLPTVYEPDGVLPSWLHKRITTLDKDKLLSLDDDGILFILGESSNTIRCRQTAFFLGPTLWALTPVIDFVNSSPAMIISDDPHDSWTAVQHESYVKRRYYK